jgi:hypothetical protein
MLPDKPSPLNRLIESANDLIASAMAQIEQGEPAKHKALMDFVEGGAVPRLLIESPPGQIKARLTLGRDGDDITVFEWRLNHVDAVRH